MCFIVFPLGKGPLRLSRVLLFLHKLAKDLDGSLVRDDATTVELVFLLLEANDGLMTFSLEAFFG